MSASTSFLAQSSFIYRSRFLQRFKTIYALIKINNPYIIFVLIRTNDFYPHHLRSFLEHSQMLKVIVFKNIIKAFPRFQTTDIIHSNHILSRQLYPSLFRLLMVIYGIYCQYCITILMVLFPIAPFPSYLNRLPNALFILRSKSSFVFAQNPPFPINPPSSA